VKYGKVIKSSGRLRCIGAEVAGKVSTVPTGLTHNGESTIYDGSNTMKMTMLHVPNRDSIFTCYLDESGTDNNCG
jgi:hypothetical protein